MNQSNDHRPQRQRESAEDRGEMNELPGNLGVWIIGDDGRNRHGGNGYEMAYGKGDGRKSYGRLRP
jgi:hypothetical protein